MKLTPVILSIGTLIFGAIGLMGQNAKPLDLSNPGALTPAEEKKTFKLASGFKIELAASEPTIIDPVALAEDEQGRLFVTEMIGYPNGGVGTGDVSSGRIKLLEDKDKDGFYETSTIFAEGLRFPIGLFPWKKGLIVANAPDLIYLEDTNNDGKADSSKVLFTGFHTYNIQQMLNSFRWGLDNQIHAVAGSNGGTITSKENPKMAPVELRGRGIRFRPDIPDSLDPVTGGGQYGLTMDSFGALFSSTNSQHLRHMVLPDDQIRRNPYLAVGSMALDIPEHGAACKVFRISPFEAWRVERTSRRKSSELAKKLPATELVPGGYSTSSCSPLLLDSDSVQAPYRDSIIICEPANNVIMRDVLEPKGLTFVSRRGDPEKEFLASTDNWFRPVHLNLCLDGSILVLDFYREVIETPLSLPEDMKAVLPLKTQGKGRIWRITPDGMKKAPSFPDASNFIGLVAELESGNQTRRMMAQKLLVERNQVGAKDLLVDLALKSQSPQARMHALCTLDGLKLLQEKQVVHALADSSPGVRLHAVRLSNKFISQSDAVFKSVSNLVGDQDARVRCQVAFAMGNVGPEKSKDTLIKLVKSDGEDRWMQTAILSSSAQVGGRLLLDLLEDEAIGAGGNIGREAFLSQLSAVSSTRLENAEMAKLLKFVQRPNFKSGLRAAILEGIAQSQVAIGNSAEDLWENPDAQLKTALDGLRPLFDNAAMTARLSNASIANRLSALRLLAMGPVAVISQLAPELLQAQTPPAIQTATLQVLSAFKKTEVSKIILDAWPSFSPSLRREAVETLFSRKDRIEAIINGMEKGIIQPSHLEASRIDQLKKLNQVSLQQKVIAILAKTSSTNRKQVVESYAKVLEMKGDHIKGKEVFRKNCATCHKFDDMGYQVGPDLLAAIRGKNSEYLLIAILDPSREVDPRYVNYTIETKQGRVFSGLLASESGTSVNLKRGENAEDTILRNQIESIQASAKSLMPEGLDMQVKLEDMSNLLAYLLQVAGK